MIDKKYLIFAFHLISSRFIIIEDQQIRLKKLPIE